MQLTLPRLGVWSAGSVCYGTNASWGKKKAAVSNPTLVDGAVVNPLASVLEAPCAAEQRKSGGCVYSWMGQFCGVDLHTITLNMIMSPNLAKQFWCLNLTTPRPCDIIYICPDVIICHTLWTVCQQASFWKSNLEVAHYVVLLTWLLRLYFQTDARGVSRASEFETWVYWPNCHI